MTFHQLVFWAARKRGGVRSYRLAPLGLARSWKHNQMPRSRILGPKTSICVPSSGNPHHSTKPTSNSMLMVLLIMPRITLKVPRSFLGVCLRADSPPTSQGRDAPGSVPGHAGADPPPELQGLDGLNLASETSSP